MADEAAIDEQPSDTADTKPRGTDWWAEARGIIWLVLAVLGFHSFVAKPFYIPSESMMPGLLVGDRLVVTKYPYGYSFVSPTFHLLPFMPGRIFGSLPERGDVVIVTPPGSKADYIKRVIGLPGDRVQVRGGIVYLNGKPVPRVAKGDRRVPIDDNTQCGNLPVESGRDGRDWCRMPIFRETLPNGKSYDTIDAGPYRQGDDYGPYTVPANHVFLMGDNRDNSSDSRFSLAEQGLGGAVPWENVGGRAEFITFSLDGSATLNPLTWFGSFRSGRAGTSLHPQRAGE